MYVVHTQSHIEELKLIFLRNVAMSKQMTKDNMCCTAKIQVATQTRHMWHCLNLCLKAVIAQSRTLFPGGLVILVGAIQHCPLSAGMSVMFRELRQLRG